MTTSTLSVGLLLLSAVAVAGQPTSSTQSRPRDFEIAGALYAASSDLFRPGRPGLAFDGNRYLVVTCRDFPSPATLLGVFLSPDGNVIEELPLSEHDHHSGCNGGLGWPSVAFDGALFLVVFSRDGQLYGLRVTPSGDVLDPPAGFPISTDGDSNFFPRVAFDGSGFLVVWNHYDEDYDIWGAQVSRGGVVSESVIYTDTSDQMFVDVACGNQNCLVVFEDRKQPGTDPEGQILGVRLSPSGSVLDPDGIAISTAPGVQSSPAVTFAAGNFLVVWTDDRLDPSGPMWDFSIFGARVHPDGIVLDGPPESGGIAINTANTDSFGKGYPSASFDGIDYLVSWHVPIPREPGGIYGARVSTEGALVGRPPRDVGILLARPWCSSCFDVLPELLFDGRKNLVAWRKTSEKQGLQTEVRGLWACRVDLSAVATSFRSECTSASRRRPEPVCTVRAALRMTNLGYTHSSPMWIDVLLSDDPALGSGDVLLNRIQSARVPSFSSRTVPLGARLPGGSSATKYIIAAFGPNAPELDCDTADNFRVLGRMRQGARRVLARDRFD